MHQSQVLCSSFQLPGGRTGHPYTSNQPHYRSIEAPRRRRLRFLAATRYKFSSTHLGTDPETLRPPYWQDALRCSERPSVYWRRTFRAPSAERECSGERRASRQAAWRPPGCMPHSDVSISPRGGTAIARTTLVTVNAVLDLLKLVEIGRLVWPFEMRTTSP